MFCVLFFSELESVDLKFLDGCLVKRGTFPGAAAQKAWGAFHGACRKNIKEISRETQLSRSGAFHLCMKVFQHLIEINYSVDEETASRSCSAGGRGGGSLFQTQIVKLYITLGEALYIH